MITRFARFGWFILGALAATLLPWIGSPLKARTEAFPTRQVPFYWDEVAPEGYPTQFQVTPQGTLAVGFGKSNILDGHRSTDLSEVVIYDMQSGNPLCGYLFMGDKKHGNMSFLEMVKRAPRR